ncbi:hypothetical protein PP7435_CHR3-0591 [Komagataella phaffii CBS 7435]|uniref:Phosphatase n=2 Tax=Komagataella phaffii TaxID=460519 RepID=C4R523_KOMPG|nr:uncharacterized protein PAS_chr3_0613 [Komagataella phaffii GS115]AOA63148.1 GQ67_03691T0 [Komagataella phaffii]KAI0463674.1 hypothetical protein LJB42_002678 [Komagataella kurtzmanii]CAH2449570.1 hypothetical protein BQ9382_C3-3160 [Komagataella phaffii CBS 7435]AOA69200.1 GQ68_03663T0 [Komagataella phaffii GS115]CAY70659.1 Putative protein of unknown function with similarity to phosphoserine phosphatases [Komagataella phaffii GS115]
MSSPKAVVFTDWDGTVTLLDSNDYLTDNLGMGKESRVAIGNQILNGEVDFRTGFAEELQSVKLPFDECIDFLLKNIELDPGFKDTYEWCYANNVPIYVISSGMKPIIETLLVKLVGQDAMDNITIISNDVKINDDGSWDIVYRDDTSFGHDKALSILEVLDKHNLDKNADNRSIPLFYCGDGVSDLSAARETDLLFARKGRELITYCEKEKVPYTEFESFDEILKSIQAILSGEKKLADFIQNKLE